MIQQILVAGNETSTSAIAGGVVLLIQNPEQQAMLRQHPDLIPGAVEEILRLETPTTWHVASRDGRHQRLGAWIFRKALF